MTSPMKEIGSHPERNRLIGIATSIGLETVPQIAVNIGQIIMKIAHHWFVDGIQIVRVKNNSIKLKWKVRKPPDIVSPPLVPPPWKIRFAAASVTQML